MNQRLGEFAEAGKCLNLRFLENQAVWNNYHTASCRYENCKPTSSARLKRSWTLKPPAHVKQPKWMSTPFARDAKNRYLRWLRLTCDEKTSGIRTAATTSRELPAEPCTFKLSGTVECASKPRHWPLVE